MTSGFRAVEDLMINNFGYTIHESKAADTRIYIDDRTFVDSDIHRALNSIKTWTTWSATVGLKENETKIPALANVQPQLQDRQPDWTQEKELKALGSASELALLPTLPWKKPGCRPPCRVPGCWPVCFTGSVLFPKPFMVGSLDQQVPAGS